MKAKQCLLYARDKFETISDAWTHINFMLSYPRYYPHGYKPKNFSDEMQELFNDYIKYNFFYLNNKGNWSFKELTIEEALMIISNK